MDVVLLLLFSLSGYELEDDHVPAPGFHFQSRSYGPLVWAPNSEIVSAHYKTSIHYLKIVAHSSDPLKEVSSPYQGFIGNA